tara:strand:- start:324 stop:563 length:240 start_codon:yes stop_codon:yes gene_type:complete
MEDTKIVEVILGEDKERIFTVCVTAWSEGGDYYTPCDSGYFCDSEVYDEFDNNVTELIERYESLYKVDFNQLAINNFNN